MCAENVTRDFFAICSQFSSQTRFPTTLTSSFQAAHPPFKRQFAPTLRSNGRKPPPDGLWRSFSEDSLASQTWLDMFTSRLCVSNSITLPLRSSPIRGGIADRNFRSPLPSASPLAHVLCGFVLPVDFVSVESVCTRASLLIRSRNPPRRNADFSLGDAFIASAAITKVGLAAGCHTPSLRRVCACT